MDPQHPNPPQELPDILRQLLSKIRRHLQLALDERRLNLSPQEAHILHLISGQPGISPLELSVLTGYDKAFITRKLSGLHDSGLVKRKANDSDNRRLHLLLSPAGKRTCVAINSARQEAHHTVFGKLSRQEQKQLTALLTKCL